MKDPRKENNFAEEENAGLAQNELPSIAESEICSAEFAEGCIINQDDD